MKKTSMKIGGFCIGLGLLFSGFTLQGRTPLDKSVKERLKPQIFQTVSFSEKGNLMRPEGGRPVFSAGRPKAGGGAYDGMFGGWSRYDVYGDFNDIFGFEIEDPTSLYELSSHPDLVNGNHKICAAAWDGKQVHFISEIYLPSYDRYVIGYRGTLDPLTGRMTLLGKSGYASDRTGNLNSLAYDRRTDKLYGTALDGVLYEVSMTDSTSRPIDSIRWNGQSIGYPMTLSVSPGGNLYTISSGGYLYRVDKRTAEATLVGPVEGESVQLAYQSAVFDQLTGKLYWARIGSEDIDLCIVDTLTGKAEFYSEFGIQAVGLFHQYYEDPCDVYPAMVENMQVEVADKTLTFTWRNPATNSLGMASDCLDKALVYRATGLADFVLIDSVNNISAGRQSSYTYTEKEDGYYRYAIQVVNHNGLFSGKTEYERGFFSYTLPYETGFEADDNNTPLMPDTTVRFVTDEELVYEGNVTAFIPAYSRLRITGLPLEKGTTYRLSFMVRGYQLGMDYKLNQPFTQLPFATLNVRIGDKVYYPEASRSMEWVPVTLDLYAKETKAYTLAFATSVFDEYYVDNVRIGSLTPNTVPGRVDEVYIENGGTLRKVDLHWKNPSVTAGDEVLQDLEGVIVQMSPYRNFSTPADIAMTDTVYTDVIGQEMTKTYAVPNDGFWHFRLVAFNKDGISPIDTVAGSAWVGRDTVFDAPSGLQATAMDNGRIRLKWNKIEEKGTHGGDLDGRITGYRVIQMDGNREKISERIVRDTVWETEALAMNFYAFSVNGIRNEKYDGDSAAVRLAGGLRGGQTVVTDITDNAGYSTAPFNVATGFSNQSTVNQLIFPVDKFAGPCIIDTLYFLIDPLSLGFTQKYRIQLGYYHKDLFTEYGDWMAIDSLTEVFSGSLRFEKGVSVLRIPIKPFYYDAGRNLLLSVIRGKQSTRMDVQVLNNPSYDYYRQIHDYHLENMSDYYELTGKPVMMTGIKVEPVFLINRVQNLNTVKGHVSVFGTDGPIAGARVEIAKSGGEGMEFSQTLFTDEAGNFSFAYFPDNRYRICISSSGKQDYENEVELKGGQIEELAVAMKDASLVVLEGYVEGRRKEAVSGARIGLAELDTVSVLSAADGTFAFENIYGSTKYTVRVSHDLYQDHTTVVQLGTESEQTMDTVSLAYFPYPARHLMTEITEDGSMELSWKKPLQNLRTTERKYHGPRKSSICSSHEIMAGIRFKKDKLREWEEAGPGLQLTSVAFQITDTTADYSIRIYSGDFETPDYMQPVGYRPLAHHRIFLDEAFRIDTTEDLLVALHVADGYKGCPIGNDAGPQLNDGAMINQGDGWRLMSDYMQGADGSNWILSAFFGASQEADAPNGYRLYRAEAGPHPCVWEPLATVGLSETSYIDRSWRDLAFGSYRYAVRADWFDDNLSQEKVSEVMDKDMIFDVKLRIEDPGSLLPAEVTLLLESEDGLDRYEKKADPTEEILLEKVRRNTYGVEIVGGRFVLTPQVFSVASDTTIRLRVTGAGVEDGVGNAVSVYPNPSADGRFTVETTLSGKFRYEILSADGRLLRDGLLTGDKTYLDTSAYGAGVYVLKVSGGGEQWMKKLIVRQ